MRVRSTEFRDQTGDPARKDPVKARIGILDQYDAAFQFRRGIPRIQRHNVGRHLLMRDEVGLDKKIILVGLGTKLEIWSEETWKSNYKAWKDQGPISVDDLPDSIKEMVL